MLTKWMFTAFRHSWHFFSHFIANNTQVFSNSFGRFLYNILKINKNLLGLILGIIIVFRNVVWGLSSTGEKRWRYTFETWVSPSSIVFPNKGTFTMRLPCIQCRRTFYLGNFYEAVHCDAGIHLLCSKECKDEWVSRVVLEEHCENMQQCSVQGLLAPRTIRSWAAKYKNSLLPVKTMHIIEELRIAANCRQYPMCEHLQTKARDIFGDLVLTRIVLLQREAASVCNQCNYFESKQTPDTWVNSSSSSPNFLIYLSYKANFPWVNLQAAAFLAWVYLFHHYLHSVASFLRYSIQLVRVILPWVSWQSSTACGRVNSGEHHTFDDG